jgi:hypothetical protein
VTGKSVFDTLDLNKKKKKRIPDTFLELFRGIFSGMHSRMHSQVPVGRKRIFPYSTVVREVDRLFDGCVIEILFVP